MRLCLHPKSAKSLSFLSCLSIPLLLTHGVFVIAATDGNEVVDDVCSNYDYACDNDPHWMMDIDIKLTAMWDRLECTELFEDDRPVPNESIWALMRGSYIGVVGPENNSMMAVVEKNQFFGNGFKPGSVEVKHKEGRGRGVYAKEAFAVGELVWSDSYTACFNDGMSYRRFLASIPADLACDVFQWAYSGESYGICVDLDEGSLMNHASSMDKKGKEYQWEIDDDTPNVAVSAENSSGTLYVAIQEINPGDEFLVDYGSFAQKHAWERFGLGTWVWDD